MRAPQGAGGNRRRSADDARVMRGGARGLAFCARECYTVSETIFNRIFP